MKAGKLPGKSPLAGVSRIEDCCGIQHMVHFVDMNKHNVCCSVPTCILILAQRKHRGNFA